MKKFGQGFCSRSQDGETLRSDNHITCYSVVLVNLEKRDAAMLHVWEGGYNGLSPAQMDLLEEFTKPLGRKVAFIAEGTMSSTSWNTKDHLQRLGVEVVDVMRLQTGDMRWNAEFDPATRRYQIIDEREKTIYDGIPLPSYTDAPKEAQGLSDDARRLTQLQKHANRSGDLPREAVKMLDDILDRSRCSWKDDQTIQGRLIYKFMNARAREAGFDDYCDYIDADRANFVKAGPQEMVLRKIFTTPDAKLRKRFRDAGRDFRKVRVTPAAVAELLQDYPRVFDKFLAKLDERQQEKQRLRLEAKRQPVA